MANIVTGKSPATNAQAVGSELLCIALMGLLLFCFAANLLSIAALIPQLEKAFGITTQKASYLIMIYALLSATLNLVAGPISDRIGRHGLMAGASLAFGASTIACGFAKNFETLLVLRAINGVTVAAIGGGTYAYLADCVSKERIAAAIGISSACTFLGTAIGVPGVVFLAQNWSLSMAFSVLGMLPVAVSLGIWFGLPKIPTGASKGGRIFEQYLGILRSRSGQGLLIYSFLIFAAASALNAFLLVWMHKALNIETTHGSLAFLCGGIASLCVSLLWGRVIKNIDIGTALALGTVVALAVHLLLPVASVLWQIAFGFAAASFAFTLRLIALQTQVAKVPAHQRGTYNSLFTAASMLGMAAGPSVGAYVLTYFAFDTSFRGFQEMNLLIAAVIALSALWIKPLLNLSSGNTPVSTQTNAPT